MKRLVIGLFLVTQQAGQAGAALKINGYTKEISLIAGDEHTAETTTHTNY